MGWYPEFYVWYTKYMCNTKARYSRITASLQIKKDNIFGIFRIGRGDGLGREEKKCNKTHCVMDMQSV